MGKNYFISKDSFKIVSDDEDEQGLEQSGCNDEEWFLMKFSPDYRLCTKWVALLNLSKRDPKRL